MTNREYFQAVAEYVRVHGCSVKVAQREVHRMWKIEQEASR